MRIRTVKPGFWINEEMATVSAEAALLAIGLLNYADDEGFFLANPKLVESAIFPLRECSHTIHEQLSELSNIGFIDFYEGSDGKKYGHVRKFGEHQRINRPTPSKIKELIDFTESSVIPHTQVTDGSGREGKGKEGSTAQARRTPFPDDLETLPDDWRDKAKAYWKRKSRPDIDPDDEFEKFKARCIRDGAKYIDWPSAWQTWYTNAVKFNDAPVRRSTSNIRHIDEVMEEERRLLNERPR